MNMIWRNSHDEISCSAGSVCDFWYFAAIEAFIRGHECTFESNKELKSK